VADFDGTTSIVTVSNSGMGNPTRLTQLVWMYLDTFGETDSGRVWADNGTGGIGWFVIDTSGDNEQTFQWYRIWTGDDGGWRPPKNNILAGRWNCVAITYDGSSTSNDPKFYLRDTTTSNLLRLIVTTQFGTPTGALTGFDTFTLGDRTSGARAFNGRMQYFQLWDRILNLNELNHAMLRPGIIQNGLIFHMNLSHKTDLRDQVGYDHGVGAGVGDDGTFPPGVIPFTPDYTILAKAAAAASAGFLPYQTIAPFRHNLTR